MNLLVFGIGQGLCGDDGAGPEAVRLWQRLHPQTAEDLRVETAELPGLTLLDLLEGMEAAVIVDAVRAPAAPGRIVRVGPEELAAFTPDSKTAHGWGVAETLHLGRSLYPALSACRVTLLGIVGAGFDPGTDLSPEVRAALPAAAESIQREIESLLSTAASKP